MDISVVIPLYNEAESLPELAAWIERVMADHDFTYEVIFVDDVDLLDRKNARVYSQSLGHNAGARLGTTVDLRLTLDNAAVEKHSKSSDRMAKDLAEKRIREEQVRLDSLEHAERDDVVRALRESGAAREEVSTTDEDEFF